MSERTAPSEHVLARHEKWVPNPNDSTSDDLKRIARFWFGSTVGNKLRKAECITALTEVFGDRAKLKAKLASLGDEERQVLAVFARYGGTLSGPVLRSELLARGVIAKEEPPGRPVFGQRDKDDPVHALGGKFLVGPLSGGTYLLPNYYAYSSYHRRSYPDLALHSAVRPLIAPAAPLRWQPSAPAPSPAESVQRSAAEVVLDLWTVAEALAGAGIWKTNRGGSLAKSAQNRLRKVLPDDESDPLVPPAPSSLYYEVLRGLGAVEAEAGEGSIDLDVVKRQLCQAESLQGWSWVRAWLQMRLWQDGIGVVPDRDNYSEPVRIEPSHLRQARELLAWALSRVAQGPDDWLDLEVFLNDLWSASGEDGIDFTWRNYTWEPKFAAARNKNTLAAGPERIRAYWLDCEGIWVANALMGTFVYLGLVERGGGPAQQRRFFFRLTRLGKAVFGAPDLSVPPAASGPRFLTVQPNYDVLVYLDAADARDVWPLAQLARRTSAPGNRVQTFVLTRESIYQGLESGLTPDEVREFLTEHSRTGLPANVAQSLIDWGRRREALVLRPGVALGVFPPGGRSSLQAVPRAEALGDRAVLLPKGSRIAEGYPVVDHNAQVTPTWRVAADGEVRTTAGTDALSLARLSQFADRDGDGWRITAASVRRAREHGIAAEQVLEWLRDHTINTIAPLVETAIRNWSSPARVFLGEVLLLQVGQPQACETIRVTPRFAPLLIGHLPPDCFLVHPEKREELERLLAELGFSTGYAFHLPQPPAQSGDGVRRRGRPRKR